jgi:DNA polymerase/3'-5' exonuclease PolX
MKLSGAETLALKVMGELAPFCARIMIAGSIRRKREEVNDIDLVLVPKGLDGAREIVVRCQHKCSLVQGTYTSQNISFRFRSGFQLDLFVAHDGVEDLLHRVPSNWGAVLLCRTGSMVHNQQLCAFAQSKGLKFAPYRGILRGTDNRSPITEEIVASETEDAIYSTLGLAYREPTEREMLE